MAELALLAETAGSEVLDAIYQRRQQARPRDVHRPRQGRGAARDRAGHRRRHRDLRRRARAQPAAQPRGPAQGQGRRPDRADPRHLRPAREVQGGPGAGRAGPAQLHEAAAARLGWQPVPPGRWPGRRATAAASAAVAPVRPRSRPTGAGSTPRSPSCAASSSDMKGTRDTKRQERRRHQIPRVAIAGYTNAGKSSLLNRLTGAGRAGRGLAVRDPRPDHAAYDDHRRPRLHDERHRRLRPRTCPTSWSRRSARRWRRSPTPT